MSDALNDPVTDSKPTPSEATTAPVAPPDPATIGARRPIKARSSRWASALAGDLIRRGVSPNAISIASVAFAAAGALTLYLTRYATYYPWLIDVLLVLTIVGIQGRLVCNLLDGMVAVEGGKGDPTGEIYNDLPDRLADPILLAAAGYATHLPLGIELGWLAAIGALLTAYVRVLGRSINAGTYFIGPMAKQHRMALLTVACVLSGVTAWYGAAGWPIYVALVVIVAGCAWTAVRRLRRIADVLRSNAAAKAAVASPITAISPAAPTVDPVVVAPLATPSLPAEDGTP